MACASFALGGSCCRRAPFLAVPLDVVEHVGEKRLVAEPEVTADVGCESRDVDERQRQVRDDGFVVAVAPGLELAVEGDQSLRQTRRSSTEDAEALAALGGAACEPEEQGVV